MYETSPGLGSPPSQPLSSAISSALESLAHCESIARQINGGLFGYQPETASPANSKDTPPPAVGADMLANRLSILGDALSNIAQRI